jgi:UDP-N-acetyl-D-mannosaminuronate dehydrogenase
MKKPIIPVVGLGFVGLTLSIVNAHHGFKTIGIDIKQEKINQLNVAQIKKIFV